VSEPSTPLPSRPADGMRRVVGPNFCSGRESHVMIQLGAEGKTKAAFPLPVQAHTGRPPDRSRLGVRYGASSG